MSKLRTLVDTKSEAFAESAERFGALMDELREISAEARRGGGEKAQGRHRERGKLPVRERIERLLDPGTAFLECSRSGNSNWGRARRWARSDGRRQ
jgi:acetyl-CoA carboxylase carboxyltransferase component